ncbi:MAG: hypothetical protein OYM47_07585 [Gemmatimonadota bacterium]|nr:hypothetical protein [Gemmatimonadota bacterium]
MKPASVIPSSTAVWMAVFLCKVLCSAAHASDNPPDAAYGKARASVVVLEVEKRNGSRVRGMGFLALDSRIAVTTWDLVDDAVGVVARFESGEAFGVSGLIDSDEKRNVALIRIKVFGRPLLELDAGDTVEIKETFIVETVEGEAFRLVDGKMSPAEIVDGVRSYPLGAAASAGGNGGPLLDESGRVIGVVSTHAGEGRVSARAIPSVYALGLDYTLPTRPWQKARRGPERLETTPEPVAEAEPPDPSAIRFRFYRAEGQRFSDVNRNLWTESILWWVDNIRKKCGGNPDVGSAEDLGVDAVAIPSEKARFTTRTTGWKSWVLGEDNLKGYIARTERHRDLHIGVFQEVRYKHSPEEKSRAVAGVHVPPNVLALYFKATRIKEDERAHLIGNLFGLDGDDGGVMSSRHPRGPGSPAVYGNMTEWPPHWCGKIAEYLDH